jgi:hypothetical protein
LLNLGHTTFTDPPQGDLSSAGNTTTTHNATVLNMVKKGPGKRHTVNPFAGKYITTYSSSTRLAADSNLTTWPPLKTEIPRDEATQAAHRWSYANLQIDNSPFWIKSTCRVHDLYGSFSADLRTGKPVFFGKPELQSFVRIHDAVRDPREVPAGEGQRH